MVLSYDQLQTALSCGQQYRYTVEDKVQMSGADRPTLLSKAVHQFLYSYYKTKTLTNSHEEAIIAGAAAARVYVRQERDRAIEARFTDENYKQVLDEVEVTSIRLSTWYIQLLPDYRLLNKTEVLPNAEPGLALEWLIVDEGRGICETVDGVFKDNETGQILLVDWKLKTSFVSDEAASIDGKLALQAAMLNSMGANIRSTCSIQLRSVMPAEAKLSKADNQPLMGSESYNSTWEYWSQSLPMNLNPRKFEAKIRPKLKSNDFFVHPVISTESAQSNKYALDNAAKIVKLIELDLLPAVLSMNTCDRCPYIGRCVLAKYIKA